MPNSICHQWFPLWKKGTQGIASLTLYPEWLATKWATVFWNQGRWQHGRWEHISELGVVWRRGKSCREEPGLYSNPAANLLCDLEYIAWSLWVLAPISVKWGNQNIFSLRPVPVLRFYGFISEELIWKDMKDSEVNNEERTFPIKCSVACGLSKCSTINSTWSENNRKRKKIRKFSGSKPIRFNVE